MATDYYGVLGVSPEASTDEIRSAFRRLAREHHPDATGGDPDSEQRYKEISEAYAVLSDPAKRQQYDAARMGVGAWSSPWSGPFAETIEDIFETFFGGGFAGRGGAGTRQATRARRGESVEVEVELSLGEVVSGTSRTIRFERFEPCERCEGQGAEPGTEPERCGDCGGTGQVQRTRRTVLGSLVTAFPCRRCSASGWVVSDPCKECRGSGRVATDVEVVVEIPPGVDDGDRMRLTGEGEAGESGGGRGDLYVRMRVTPDERFERMGDDLFAWVEIPMTLAALGGKVNIETFDGPQVIDVPAGTHSTDVFRLKGKGAPRRTGRGRGDLLVRAHVLTPTKLGRKDKELVRELAERRGEDPKKDALSGRLRRTLGPSDR